MSATRIQLSGPSTVPCPVPKSCLSVCLCTSGATSTVTPAAVIAERTPCGLMSFRRLAQNAGIPSRFNASPTTVLVGVSKNQWLGSSRRVAPRSGEQPLLHNYQGGGDRNPEITYLSNLRAADSFLASALTALCGGAIGKPNFGFRARVYATSSLAFSEVHSPTCPLF